MSGVQQPPTGPSPHGARLGVGTSTWGVKYNQHSGGLPGQAPGPPLPVGCYSDTYNYNGTDNMVNI